MSDELEPIRQGIDEHDRELVRLLNERLKLAGKIGELKRSSGGSIYASEREDKVLRKVSGLNDGPIKDEALQAIYREIMSAAIALEKPTSIAYLGPEATNTPMNPTIPGDVEMGLALEAGEGESPMEDEAHIEGGEESSESPKADDVEEAPEEPSTDPAEVEVAAEPIAAVEETDVTVETENEPAEDTDLDVAPKSDETDPEKS